MKYLRLSIIFLLQAFILPPVLSQELKTPAEYDDIYGTVFCNPGTGFYASGRGRDQLTEYRYGKTFPSARVMSHASEVLDEDCVSEDGRVIEDVMREQIRRSYDRIFRNFELNKKFYVRLLPMMSQPHGDIPSYCGCKSVLSNQTESGTILIWYPEKLYRAMQKTDFPPTVGYDEDHSLSVVDWRNPLVLDFYDTFLRLFSEYLEEEVDAPQLESATDAPLRCHKGDFVLGIEIGFMGPWGEGSARYYRPGVTSDDFIRVTELYKKYFYKYNIIAPSDVFKLGMRPIVNLFDFYHYLMTTTYGNTVPDADGLYSGGREFGLFLDHIGSDSHRLGDFGLRYKGRNYRSMAKKKHLKAPFYGEMTWRSGIRGAYRHLNEDISDFGISILGTVDRAFRLESAEDSIDVVWARAMRNIGYRFRLESPGCYVKGRDLVLDFTVENENDIPCYDRFWREKIVVRDASTDEIVKVVDIHEHLDVNKIGAGSVRVHRRMKVFSEEESVSLRGREMKLLLRIEDSAHVCENMILDSDCRTAEGEYVL